MYYPYLLQHFITENNVYQHSYIIFVYSKIFNNNKYLKFDQIKLNIYIIFIQW